MSKNKTSNNQFSDAGLSAGKFEGIPSEVATKVIKRSVRLSGHLTSVALEQVFWEALYEIAQDRARSVSSLINELDQRCNSLSFETGENGTPAAKQNLTSVLRVFILQEYSKLKQG